MDADGDKTSKAVCVRQTQNERLSGNPSIWFAGQPCVVDD